MSTVTWSLKKRKIENPPSISHHFGRWEMITIQDHSSGHLTLFLRLREVHQIIQFFQDLDTSLWMIKCIAWDCKLLIRIRSLRWFWIQLDQIWDWIQFSKSVRFIYSVIRNCWCHDDDDDDRSGLRSRSCNSDRGQMMDEWVLDEERKRKDEITFLDSDWRWESDLWRVSQYY